MISNAMLRDPRLSLKAKGLLGVMLSVPDGKPYRMSQLEAVSDDGRDAHRTAVQELEAAGYLTRQQKRDERGRLAEAEYTVSDALLTVDGFSGDGEPVHGSNIVPHDKKPALEIPPILTARPQFAEAWAEWLAYRRERKLSRTERTLRSQLRLLAAQPDPEACIQQTITNGWNGLFELRGVGKPQTTEQANSRARQNAQQIYHAITQEPDNVPF